METQAMTTDTRRRWSITLYWINAALLLTHEIDSAYWHEWKLFGVPGDIEGFLLFNFVLIVIVLHGFRQLLLEAPSGRWYAVLLGGGGVFAFTVHLTFIALGRSEFATLASVALLVCTGVASLVQIVLAVRLPAVRV